MPQLFQRKIPQNSSIVCLCCANEDCNASIFLVQLHQSMCSLHCWAGVGTQTEDCSTKVEGWALGFAVASWFLVPFATWG